MGCALREKRWQRLRQRGGGGDVAESELERGPADRELHSERIVAERHDHALGCAYDWAGSLLHRDCEALPDDGSEPGRELGDAVDDAVPAGWRELVVDVQLGPDDARAF